MCEVERVVAAIEAEADESRATWAVTPEIDRVPPAFFRKYMEGLTRAVEIARDNSCRSEESDDSMRVSSLS